jgi:acylphosphatase
VQTIRLYVRVRGRVQGVGYRFHARQAAQARGLSGWVRNCTDGSVECEVQGRPEEAEAFVEQLRGGPPLALVSGVETAERPPLEREEGFSVRF